MTKKEILNLFKVWFTEAEANGVFDADTGAEEYDFLAVLRLLVVLVQVDEAHAPRSGDVVGQVESFYDLAAEAAENYLADCGDSEYASDLADELASDLADERQA